MGAVTDVLSEAKGDDATHASMAARAEAIRRKMEDRLKSDPVYRVACASPWHPAQCAWERGLAFRAAEKQWRGASGCAGLRYVRPQDIRAAVDARDPRLVVPCPRHGTAGCLGARMAEYEEREDWYERCGIARRYRYARRELIPAVQEFWDFADRLKHEVRAGNGLLVFGGVGVGKTMALSYLADRARDEWLEARFVFTPDLFDLFIMSARARSDEERAGHAKIDEFQSCDLLLLDDFGVEYVGSDYVVARFESFVEHRHRACLSTVVTTNLSPGALNEAGVWRRVVDRWHQTCRAVVFVGKSQRRGGAR